MRTMLPMLNVLKPRSKNEAKNQNLNQTRQSFDFVIIRFVFKKTSSLKKERRHQMKNGGVPLIRLDLAKNNVTLLHMKWINTKVN